MKIVVITNNFQFDYETNFANGLINHARKVYLIGGDQYPVEKLNPSIDFINLRGSHNEDAPLFRKVYRVIKYYVKLLFYVLRSDAKLIHFIWMRFPVLEGILLTSIFRLFKKRCIYTVHDVVPHDRDNRKTRIVYGLVYLTQNKLLAHTDYIKTRLMREFGIKESKIHIFKHGVYDINISHKISEGAVRKEFNLGVNDFIILFYGAIAKYKGLDLLIQTFEELEQKCSMTLKLIVAGKVHANYQKAFNKLEKSVSSPNITILKGYVDGTTTQKLFTAANVTVLPYYEASQSGVLFLSYAYGVPVIAPSFGGFPSDVVSGMTGYLFNKGDQQSLANAIVKVRDGIGEKIFKKEKIREFARAEYSWDLECKKLMNLFYE